MEREFCPSHNSAETLYYEQFMYQSASDPVEYNVYVPVPSSDSGLSAGSILKFFRLNVSLLSAAGEPMGESVSSLGSSIIVVGSCLCLCREECGVE